MLDDYFGRTQIFYFVEIEDVDMLCADARMSAMGRYLDICLHCILEPKADTQISDLRRYLGIYFGQIHRYLLGQILKCMLCEGT